MLRRGFELFGRGTSRLGKKKLNSVGAVRLFLKGSLRKGTYLEKEREW